MEFDTLLKIVSSLLQKGELTALRSMLKELNIVDIASMMDELEPGERLRLFRIMSKDMSADVFSYLEPDSQEEIVRMITDKELGALIDEMYLDDTVDFLEEVPASVVTRVLKNSSPENRAEINRYLKYPDSSAGSIMTNEMVRLLADMTAGQAIANIRDTGIDKETVYTCYVTDKKHTLLGMVPLLSLLLSNEDKPVSEIMQDDKQLISVHTHDDQETVAEIVKKYDLLSVPVVDNEERLVGIITVDDVIDVIEDEVTEDFEKMAKITHSDDGYLKTGVFTHYKNRIVWLMILMISATFTGALIDSFEAKLSGIIGLIACIPMLMDTGGNSGNQASTLIIRGLAVGDVVPRDVLKILWKEVRVALLCGLSLAVVNALRMLLLWKLNINHFQPGEEFTIILVVSMSLAFAVVVAKCIGCLLPIGAKAIHLDPALMAGPMLTTVVDLITLAIYLSLASLFIPK